MLRSCLSSTYLRQPLAAAELHSALLLQLPLPLFSAACSTMSFSHHRNLCPSIHCSSRSLCSSSSAPPLPEAGRQVLQVRPYYGLLSLKGNLKFVIKPDIEHQCGSVCTVRLLAPPGSPARLQFKQSSDLALLSILAHGGDNLPQRGQHEEEPHCEVRIPIKYNLRASLSGSAGLELLELQNDSTSVSTETGSCTVHKLQALKMHYTTDSGPLLIRKKLLASLSARGRQLTITGGAVQAGAVAVSAEEVHCSLQSVHANSVSVQAASATLAIKDITAATTLSINNADIDIGNCSGALSWQLKEARARVGVPQLLEDSFINIDSGQCSVACPAEYRYGIQVRGQQVTVRSGFHDVVHGGGASDEGNGGLPREEGALQEARVSVPGPQLRVVVRRGSVALVPWTWPLTIH